MHGKAALTEKDDFAAVERALEARRNPRPAPVSWLFVAFMALLTLVLAGLGVWQLQRLEWKQTLIERVEARTQQDPVPLPPAEEWVGLDPEVYDFRPVTLTGTFVRDNTVLVFTALSEPRGARGGPGYWVMTPFRLARGGTVIVNRGFIPQDARELFTGAAAGAAPPEGTVTITGLARASQSPNAFTPGPDLDAGIEYVRNIARLTAMMPADLAPVADVYVDQDARDSGGLPQSGETVVSFPNRHFEYALTWFALAGVTVVMTGVWVWRRVQARRHSRAGQESPGA